jgi:hypothetical protein
MPTKALQTLVLPILRYAAPSIADICEKGDIVTFTHKSLQLTSHWRVVDYTKSTVLSIEALHIVSYAPDAPGIYEQASERNDNSFGKFIPVPGFPPDSPETPDDLLRVRETHLKYVLELPYRVGMNPTVFAHALTVALDTVESRYIDCWVGSLERERLKEQRLFDRIKETFG